MSMATGADIGLRCRRGGGLVEEFQARLKNKHREKNEKRKHKFIQKSLKSKLTCLW